MTSLYEQPLTVEGTSGHTAPNICELGGAVTYRRNDSLDDAARSVVGARLSHAKAVAAQALDDFHVDVHLANTLGMTIVEIAEVLGERPSTVGDWSKKGRAVLAERGA
ncbi:hypothetical protein [Streptomyces flavochromogenes]|uniref:hypothetical protein n=1 Tax=Streptomyces flavochromogenes TaxID=68199 RepID=UPI00131D2017|nr:hypothetical protein [Streptomyces flavochromogenes]